MELSYRALPHDTHKSSQQCFDLMSIQLDSQKESEQQFSLCFDYFINFSHEKSLSSLFSCMFMTFDSSPEETNSTVWCKTLSLHRNDSYGSRVVKCVHQKGRKCWRCSETQKQNAQKGHKTLLVSLSYLSPLRNCYQMHEIGLNNKQIFMTLEDCKTRRKKHKTCKISLNRL